VKVFRSLVSKTLGITPQRNSEGRAASAALKRHYLSDCETGTRATSGNEATTRAEDEVVVD